MHIFLRTVCSGGFQTSVVPLAMKKLWEGLQEETSLVRSHLGLRVSPEPPGPDPLATALPDMTPHLNLTVKLNLGQLTPFL